MLARGGSTWSLGIPGAALDRAARIMRLSGTALVPAALTMAPVAAPAVPAAPAPAMPVSAPGGAALPPVQLPAAP